MTKWANKKITVLGLGRSGVSAAIYLAERGAQVLVSESSAAKAAETNAQITALNALNIQVETGGHSDLAISFADLIVTSPGIPPTAHVIRKAQQAGKEIICDVELAFRETDVPMIAITGTNGKSTTCALISHILTHAGKVAPACGNFGIPILDQLKKNPDYLVVEVSSFQLHYSPSIAPKVAIWLNLTPDHVDWHGTLDAYIKAKQQLFDKQKPDQYAIFNFDDQLVKTTKTKARVFPFAIESKINQTSCAFMQGKNLVCRINGKDNILCKQDELKIIGKHNLENALAAALATSICSINLEDISRYLKDFQALEHRLELVAEIDGIKYYNDSKATNAASTIKALESFPDHKVVLIAGGRDKGTNLDHFVASTKKHANAVILIGEAAERFGLTLKAGGFDQIHFAKSMEEAIDLGGQLKLGPVLLSPACASFDMFKNYEERGRVFKDLIYARARKLAPKV